MLAVGQGHLFLIVVEAHQEVVLLMDHPNEFEEEGALVTDMLMSSVTGAVHLIVLL